MNMRKWKKMENIRRILLTIIVLLAFSINQYSLAGETTDSIKQHISNIGSENSSVAKRAIDELLAKDKKVTAPFIIEVLKSRDAGDLKKCNAINLLGRMGSKEAAPGLTELLDDEKPIIRKEAIKALGMIKARAAIHKLKNMLRTEADPSVLNEAVKALGDLEADEAVDDIIATVRESYLRPDGYGPVLKESAIESLGKIKSEKAVASLTDILRERENPLIKDKAVWALGEIGVPDSIVDLELHLERLEAIKPTEEMLLYEWQKSVDITKQAIEKIKSKNRIE